MTLQKLMNSLFIFTTKHSSQYFTSCILLFDKIKGIPSYYPSRKLFYLVYYYLFQIVYICSILVINTLNDNITI